MLLAVHLLAFLKQASWKKVLVLFSIVASLVFSSKAIQQYYENLIEQEIGEGTPKIAYVTMGLRDDPNRKSLGGWYDAYNTKILQRNHFNETRAQKMAV